MKQEIKSLVSDLSSWLQSGKALIGEMDLKRVIPCVKRERFEQSVSKVVERIGIARQRRM